MKNFTLRIFMSLIFMVSVVVQGYAQDVSISGKVTDGTEGMPGVTVQIKGTSTGDVTDMNGDFNLNASSGDILVFSFIGYLTQELTVGSQTTVNVELAEDVEQLEEVIVVGYGSTAKKDITGSVSSVTAKDFNVGTIVSPDQLFQGKVSGVQVTSNSGQPGGGITVRVRGNNSIRAGQQPLYVIDGVPMDGRSGRPDLFAQGLGNTPPVNPFNFINSDDIDNISILKDAASAAIYGSRGANGVVLITTKKGRPGETTINASATVGVSQLRNGYDVLNATQYRSALSDYGLTGGDEGSDVNAMDEIMQSGLWQQYNMSVGGGTHNSTYRVSLGYLDQEGIIKGSGIKRLSGSVKTSNSLLDDKLIFDGLIMLGLTQEKLAPISTDAGFTGNVIGQALQWNPTSPLYDENGVNGYNVLSGSTTLNPVAYLAAFDDEADVSTVLAAFAPSYKITDDLTVKYQLGVNQSIGTRKYQTRSWINVQGVEGRGIAATADQNVTSVQHLFTAAYNKEFSSSFKLSALLGYEYQEFNFENRSMGGFDFGFEDVDYWNIMQATDPASRVIGSSATPTSKIKSYFGRVGFTMAENFNVMATLRADGSSKFGENNQWGYFPSLSASYNLDDIAIFNNLKFRAGWGQMGNQEFPPGASLARYQINDGGSVQRTAAQNPDLKWETTTTLNVGVDFSLLDYRFNGTIEYFNKNTSDLLVQQALAPPGPGSTIIWRNLDGNIINSGIDLELNYYIIQNSDIEWNVGVLATFITNELKNYDGAPIEVGGLFGQGISGATSQRIANGQPLNVFYLRQFEGIGEDGQSIYSDNEALAYNGNPNPSTLLSITSSFNYKKFFANVAFNGAYGHQIYNNTKNTVIPIGNLGTRNVDASLVGVTPQEAQSNPIKASTRYLEDGDYMKLTNMTLGYDFGTVGSFRNVQAYVTGTNLLVFTKYSGFDPEVNTVNFNQNGVPSLGIEYTPYPQNRTFLLGVKFSL